MIMFSVPVVKPELNPAFVPMQTLEVPVVIDRPALGPSTTLLLPVDTLFPAAGPIATLDDPVFSPRNVSTPMPILLEPLTGLLENIDAFPIATLFEPPDGVPPFPSASVPIATFATPV